MQTLGIRRSYTGLEGKKTQTRKRNSESFLLLLDRDGSHHRIAAATNEPLAAILVGRNGGDD
jgi:hypothetical protein